MIQPMNDRILLRRIDDQFKKSQIILTDDESSRWFQVVACGPGKKLKSGAIRPMDVKPGDIVYLPGHAVSHPDHEDGELLMAMEDDIGFKLNEA